jgi:PhnB protein
MTKKISPLPKGYRTVTPRLVVRGVETAIAFYAAAFNAKELSRTYALDGESLIQAELKIGNAIILLQEEMPAYGILSPASIGGTGSDLQLYLDDVESVWFEASQAGAQVVLDLVDAYWGERFGKMVDPYGHLWTLAQRIEVLTKKEIHARAAALYAPEGEAEESSEISAAA